ncbi:MAG: sulfur carrier protein ThiS [Planctomyces sp.]|nr:sulfur carrier protein ThiS [Planctomyces sp.]
MELVINGECRQIPDGWTIADLLASLKIENRYCAVERNLELVPREHHEACRLSAGDRIEIVTLVGGG